MLQKKLTSFSVFKTIFFITFTRINLDDLNSKAYEMSLHTDDFFQLQLQQYN